MAGDSCLQFADYVGLQSALIKGSNFVFSPLSIRAALSLAAAGSQGQTLHQFLSFLGSTSIDHLNAASDRLLASVRVTGAERDDGAGNKTRLSFVNGVWVDQSLTLKPSFNEIANSIYQAAATSLDFQNKPQEAVGEVNAWVQTNTNGLIKNLIPTDAVDELTRVVLANALYFKGPWLEKFNSSKTKDREFHLLDGKHIQAPFMTSRMDQFIASFDGFKVVKLPYKPDREGRNFSMLIFLPDNQNGLGNLVQKAMSSPSFFNSYVPATQVEVGDFMIPKFKISTGFEATKGLLDMGLRAPFSREADFTEMVWSSQNNRSDQLYISGVYHKATIEVEEEGTEASAATAITAQLMCFSLRPPINFVADHPFMFAIREEQTGAILFLRHVLNPVSEVETTI